MVLFSGFEKVVMGRSPYFINPGVSSAMAHAIGTGKATGAGHTCDSGSIGLTALRAQGAKALGARSASGARQTAGGVC